MADGRDITAEVRRIIKEQLDVDEAQIKPESTFIDDLGADSLGLVELVLAFEEAFEIDIPDEDTEKIRSVQDAVDYIEKHAKKLAPALRAVWRMRTALFAMTRRPTAPREVGRSSVWRRI